MRMKATPEGLVAEWLDVNSAVMYSGLGRTTLWRYVEAGEIIGTTIGRSRRISRTSIDEFMMRNSNQDTQETQDQPTKTVA